jgi:hypothetical protein
MKRDFFFSSSLQIDTSAVYGPAFWEHLDAPRRRPPWRAQLQPWVIRALAGLALLVALAGAIRVTTLVHEKRQLERALCAEQLRSLKARSSLAQTMVHPADACLAVEVVRFYERSR